MSKLFIGARIIYTRETVSTTRRYIGQIIDIITNNNGTEQYYIKFDNVHAFCTPLVGFDTDNVKYMCVRNASCLTLSKQQINYSTEDMTVTPSGKIVPKDICKGINTNDGVVYFTYEDTRHYFVCEHCGLIHHSDMRTVITNSERKICKTCVDSIDDIYKCPSCGRYFEKDCFIEIEGQRCCTDCFSNEYNVIDDYHSFKNDALDSGYVYYGDTHNNSVPYLGFELETENINSSDTDAMICAYQLKKSFDGIEVATEYDGSLCYGFEFITSPMTYEYHTSINEKYKHLISLYETYNMKATNDCGLHIHINRNYFDNVDSGILNILTIFDKFWGNIEIMSRRDINNLNRWAKKPRETPSEFIEKNKAGRGERYVAVNLTNSHTIEFRVFKSTTDWNTLKQALCFINNVAIVSKYMSNSDIVNNVTWENLMSEEFANALIANMS